MSPILEKCIEQDRPLYVVFVDFSNAFDTVGRTGLWQLRRKYGCQEKFTTVIEALHTGMIANVSVGGEVSESFSVTMGSSKVVYWPPRSVYIPFFRFSFSNLRTKNEKRIPFSFSKVK